MLREHHTLPVPWPMKHISIQNSNNQFNCRLLTNLERSAQNNVQQKILIPVNITRISSKEMTEEIPQLWAMYATTFVYAFFQTQVIKASLTIFLCHSKTKPELLILPLDCNVWIIGMDCFFWIDLWKSHLFIH